MRPPFVGQASASKPIAAQSPDQTQAANAALVLQVAKLNERIGEPRPPRVPAGPYGGRIGAKPAA